LAETLMLVRKSKKAALFLSLAALSTVYFGTFSSLDMNFVLRNYLMFFPVQVGILIYLLWWRKRGTHEGPENF
jgi:hypothetical protein